MLSGHFLSMTAISQHAGDLLKRHSPRPYHYPFTVENTNRKNKKKQEIWQHCGWEYCLRDERDFQEPIDYIGYQFKTGQNSREIFSYRSHAECRNDVLFTLSRLKLVAHKINYFR
jgi:hypothetical protein